MAKIISFDTGLTINMCEPTAAQQMCHRFAITDAVCACEGDCVDCPGAELLAEKRARCGQSVFGGCSGPDCDRSCSATILSPKITVASRTTSIWELLGWTAVIWVILASAMSMGLSREAPHYEISERV